jgi:hypothetical protein
MIRGAEVAFENDHRRHEASEPGAIFYDCQPLSNIHRRLRLSKRLSLQR